MNTSDRNGRVLVACHLVLSLAFDFFLDVLALTQTESNDGRLEWARARHHADVKSITVIQSWLRHLEELCGLVCCALHELDFNYYSGQLHQLQALMTELPSFLQKMEQVQSKKHTVLLFLKNLNKILKRIANKNELKGVAGNGGGVAEEAKKICERLRLMETAVSTALVYVLNSKVAQERLARTLVAMDYIWKRVMGSASLCEFMTGTAESTEGFWAKLKRRVTNLIAFLLNPGPFFMKQAKHLQALLASIAKSLFSSDESSSAYDAPEDNSTEPNQAEQMDPATTAKNALVDRSYFPFCSMESLLDHFGYTSLRAKKIKQTMTIAGVRERVLKLLSGIFEIPPDTIEKLSVIQLEAQLQKLNSDQIKAVFYQLQKHLDKVEAGIQLHLVEKIPFELRLFFDQ
uniref:Uncharacterized protein n=1 Tax=Globisporangium ultimum (strain ATCC 200006 / CBS 805.95 / DAOM BR144) TaxID=431595 RepID=K3XA77_GLOUD